MDNQQPDPSSSSNKENPVWDGEAMPTVEPNSTIERMEIDDENEGPNLPATYHYRMQGGIPRRHRHSQIRHTLGGPSQSLGDSWIGLWTEPPVDVFVPANADIASSDEMLMDYIGRASTCFANSNGRSYDSQYFPGFNRNPEVHLVTLLPNTDLERLEDKDEVGTLLKGPSIDCFNAGRYRHDDEEKGKIEQQLQPQEDEGEVEQSQWDQDEEVETSITQIQKEEGAVPDPKRSKSDQQTSEENQISDRVPHEGDGDAGANAPASQFTSNIRNMSIYRSIVSPPSATALTYGMIRANDDALDKPEDCLIGQIRATKLYQKDLATLRDRDSGWLTDPVIDLYLELIKANYPRVYVFESSFFTLLTAKDGAEKVEQAASEINAFDYDLLLFPFCQSSHWRLLVANIPDKKISSYNSLSWSSYTTADNESRKTLEKFLKAEASRRSIPEFDWIKVREHVPLQDNLKDCGVFLLQFARYVCRGEPFNFTAHNMTYFRERILYECSTQQLLAD